MRYRAIALLITLLCSDVTGASGQEQELTGAAALGVALRELGTTKRVLMVGAHPDDENTAVLAELALGHGAEVAYLSLTRGEGGQNLIGPELQEGLGLIRTEELLSARRLDRARQYFTRAYDFGFSRSADEAFAHWPHDSVLADVVAVVRTFKPDIIVPVFSGTPRDGHGHHQVSGILAREAFTAAADPARFPAQIAAGLTPHRATYVYQALYGPPGDDPLWLTTGDYDALLGRSHFQIAMASRSRHRSQDMGQAQPVGPRRNALRLAAGEPPAGAASLFAGIDTTLVQHAERARAAAATVRQLADYEAAVRRAQSEFNPLDRAPSVTRLVEAIRLLDAVQTDNAALRARVDEERADAAEALQRAAGVVLDVTADRSLVVPGEAFELTTTLWNGGTSEIAVAAVSPMLPTGWSAARIDSAEASTLASGAVLTRRYRVTPPIDAQPSEPYFLRAPRAGDLYAWPDDPAVRGLPFERRPVYVQARVQLHGVALNVSEPAAHVIVDKAFGERRRPLLVVPAVNVQMDPAVLALPLDARGVPRTGQLTIRVALSSVANDTLRGTVQLDVPSAWRATASEPTVRLAPGARSSVEFTLSLPGAVDAGTFPVRARFRTDDAREFDAGYTIVDYPHIEPRLLFAPAQTKIAAFPVAIAANLNVGYIEGAGDDGARALAQLGARVTALDSAALAAADLSQYDAIVAGIRAYETRTDLIEHNDRLLAYAADGGTFVVQYNKYELVTGGFTPHPLTMAQPHGRVTDESAPVRILAPEHPLLSTPNAITPADFEGWVHERGLYYADTWSEAYAPLLEMADPGQDAERGSLLVARHGQGYYVYTGLALFRQLPEGVPGAYRLLANLASLRARTGT